MRHMAGVSFSQKPPMDLTPPSRTTPQMTAAATVVIHAGIPRLFCTAVDMV